MAQEVLARFKALAEVDFPVPLRHSPKQWSSDSVVIGLAIICGIVLGRKADECTCSLDDPAVSSASFFAPEEGAMHEQFIKYFLPIRLFSHLVRPVLGLPSPSLLEIADLYDYITPAPSSKRPIGSASSQNVEREKRLRASFIRLVDRVCDFMEYKLAFEKESGFENLFALEDRKVDLEEALDRVKCEIEDLVKTYPKDEGDENQPLDLNASCTLKPNESAGARRNSAKLGSGWRGETLREHESDSVMWLRLRLSSKARWKREALQKLSAEREEAGKTVKALEDVEKFQREQEARHIGELKELNGKRELLLATMKSYEDDLKMDPAALEQAVRAKDHDLDRLHEEEARLMDELNELTKLENLLPSCQKFVNDFLDLNEDIKTIANALSAVSREHRDVDKALRGVKAKKEERMADNKKISQDVMSKKKALEMCMAERSMREGEYEDLRLETGRLERILEERRQCWQQVRTERESVMHEREKRLRRSAKRMGAMKNKIEKLIKKINKKNSAFENFPKLIIQKASQQLQLFLDLNLNSPTASLDSRNAEPSNAQVRNIELRNADSRNTEWREACNTEKANYTIGVCESENCEGGRQEQQVNGQTADDYFARNDESSGCAFQDFQAVGGVRTGKSGSNFLVHLKHQTTPVSHRLADLTNFKSPYSFNQSLDQRQL